MTHKNLKKLTWEFFGVFSLINTLNSHIFKFNFLKTNKIEKHITTTNKKTKITLNCLIIQKKMNLTKKMNYGTIP
jgi:hypothetical protein